MATTAPDPSAGGLGPRLAAVLPSHRQLRFLHLSTPPLKTDALCSAPPNERPDRTYCERHFLAASIDVPPAQSPASREAGASSGAGQVLVLGIEIFLYTTAHATTLFVAKADSTGFLHLLGLPRGTPSPIREVCAAFIAHLVDTRRRKGVQFIVSLFARAQDQYLFPGSVTHGGKHVLDDRGLVRWWCRVLDPLVASPPAGDAAPWKRVEGYLVVPGLDAHETRAFIPRGSASWTLDHPLERISHYCREFDWIPPRCLIPRFPDDPKSRFRDELDEEAAKSGAMQTTGSWKSVKTLDMFWEMMAFRQECSSGRMTGFIWVVFDDELERDKPSPSDAQVTDPLAPETPKKQRMAPGVVPNTTPKKLFPSKLDTADESTRKAEERKNKREGDEKKKKKKKKLRGPIQPRQPRIKTEQRNYLLDRPTSSKHYYWPPQGRGEKIVDEGDYKRIVELLLHLDFATLDKATGSTRRWVGEAGMGGRWGLEVTGTRELPVPAPNGDAAKGAAPVNNLSGLVKRKRADAAESGEPRQGHDAGSVNVLDTGLVRKKPKA